MCSGHIAFVCQKFCATKEDAEEVVQDTFMIAYRKANELIADTLLGYLRRIAINECYRKRDSRQQYTFDNKDDEIESDPEVDENFLPEESLLNAERRTRLLQTIEMLPKVQQEMTLL